MNKKIIASKKIEKYFSTIDKEVAEMLIIAQNARQKQKDPVDYIETAITDSMAERVVKLVATQIPEIDDERIIKRILELETKYNPLDWRVAFTISKEIAIFKFVKFSTDKDAIEAGIRVGFAYLTGGIVAAPLEGLIKIDIRERNDGKKYLAIVYAGPIRGAGGTASAVSIILSDYVRRSKGLSDYDPTEEEIYRACTEIYDYHERVSNLQYLPSEEELFFMIKNIKVQIDGEPTSQLDVSNYKDLDRVTTNKIRGGMCLVIGEGITQKAQKIWKKLSKWQNDKNIQWSFLLKFLEIQQNVKSKQINSTQNVKNKTLPNYTYIKDLVAGRPVYGMPMRQGGFRIRAGKTRISGFSTVGLHPSTLAILDNFIAYGTQLKIERPGKSASVTICDTIEPPIVLLKDDSVVKVNTLNDLKINKEILENLESGTIDYELSIKISEQIKEILFLGDVLINYGDFSENGQKLVPLGYNSEWWNLQLNEKIKELQNIDDDFFEIISKERINEIKRNKFEKILFNEAYFLSYKLGIPLHPEFVYYYNMINKDDLVKIIEFFQKEHIIEYKNKIFSSNEIKIKLNNSNYIKEIFQKIGLEYGIAKSKINISKENTKGFLFLVIELIENYQKVLSLINNCNNEVLWLLNQVSTIKIKDKLGTFMGARMGRPEKSKPRNILGSPNVLFPVTETKNKNILDLKEVTDSFIIFYCEKCNKRTLSKQCYVCGAKTKKGYYDKLSNRVYFDISDKVAQSKNMKRYIKTTINVEKMIEDIGLKSEYIKLKKRDVNLSIKGITKLDNKNHVVENLYKGLARAKESLSVNKDGTMRYDMSECPIIAFKPREIGLSVEKCKKLGYKIDIKGEEIINDNQIIRMFPQDLILPSSEDTTEMQADVFLLKSGKILDDMLVNLYGEKKYYRFKSKEDLIGTLVVGLAPHISCGTVGRVIGFTKNQVMLAHPLFHAALRRDCDGDEACISLLFDVLLNFSKEYLPDRRGARTMDAPLILSTKINPSEVDDQIHGYDISDNYGLDFYKASENRSNPWDVYVKQLKEILDTKKQYEQFNFTHNINNINSKVIVSSYKQLPTMKDKLNGQMKLAEKIRSVDENKVAELVLDKHFMKDIKGNFRKFFKQNFRCSNCGNIFSRPPLMGVCTKCRKGNIVFTVAPGSVIKYLNLAKGLCDKYKIPTYSKESFKKIMIDIGSVFVLKEEK